MSDPNKDLEDLKEKRLGVRKKRRKRLVAKHGGEISKLEEENREKRKRYQK